LTYRNHILALAARWKSGGGDAAARLLAMLPDDRRQAAMEALDAKSGDPARIIEDLLSRESRRLTQWGRERYGAGKWDRLDPRVRQRLVQTHGRNH
jgi:monoamine oxidase